LEGKEIAGKLIGALVLIVTFLGYFIEVSPFIEAQYGSYFRGLLDGGVATIILMALIFYVSPFFGSDKQSQEKDESNKETLYINKVKLTKAKIDPKLVQECLDKLMVIDRIFHHVIEKAGGLDVPFRLRITVNPEEENEYRQNIDWLAENYPSLSTEASRVLRQEYFDPIRGIKVRDYDPLLQIISHNSLQTLLNQHSYEINEFNTNLEGSRMKLLALLGSLKKK